MYIAIIYLKENRCEIVKSYKQLKAKTGYTDWFRKKERKQNIIFFNEYIIALNCQVIKIHKTHDNISKYLLKKKQEQLQVSNI